MHVKPVLDPYISLSSILLHDAFSTFRIATLAQFSRIKLSVGLRPTIEVASQEEKRKGGDYQEIMSERRKGECQKEGTDGPIHFRDLSVVCLNSFQKLKKMPILVLDIFKYCIFLKKSICCGFICAHVV